MAKKSQTLKKALSDNKVSGREARALKSSGVRAGQVRSAAAAAGASVSNRASQAYGGRVSKQAAAPSWQRNSIGQYATGGDVYGRANTEGVFDGAAWMRARNVGGFTDQQIRDYLSSGTAGVTIGRRPQMVLDNWATENPMAYNNFANGPAAQYSMPGRVMFNPLGEQNMGLGTGGLQDLGISWYSTQGNQNQNFANAPMGNMAGEQNLLENNYYIRTPEGMNRIFMGESPVPSRYMGDPKTAAPSSAAGSVPYGYNSFSSPSALTYQNNMNYRGSWMPKATGVNVGAA